MGLYSRYILPKAINWACKQNPAARQRQKIVPSAYGHVLEIGIGSGLNLPFYDPDKVSSVLGVDPHSEVWEQRDIDPDGLPFEFEFVEANAEVLPFEDHVFDSVVVTYTLCSIDALPQALHEIRRVLKPQGALIFCEHGKAPDKSVARWQNIVNPVWRQFSGGCNLNRDIPTLITGNGFALKQLDTMYIPGWKPGSFNFWGIARPG